MTSLRTRQLCDAARVPLLMESATSSDLAEVVATRRAMIEDRLLECGALLFRGFAVSSVACFERAVGALAYSKMGYVNGSSPRTALGNGIFTSTEHPADLPIELHNECAYQRDWPLKIAFCCLVPAHTGGETPLADMRAVTQAIGGDLLQRFEQRGVRYVRHFQPHVDVSWQKVFQTEDRAALARICAERDIAHQWLDGGVLRTTQTCQGVARHPQTGERLLFNQAHLFHVSSHQPEEMQALLDVFGPDRLPKHCYYGDGGAIALDDLAAVRAALHRHTVSFRWQAGDVLLLDNMQVAHGRAPFRGARHVIAALLDPNVPQPASRAAS